MLFHIKYGLNNVAMRLFVFLLYCCHSQCGDIFVKYKYPDINKNAGTPISPIVRIGYAKEKYRLSLIFIAVYECSNTTKMVRGTFIKSMQCEVLLSIFYVVYP